MTAPCRASLLVVLPVLFATDAERAFFTARPWLVDACVEPALALPAQARLAVVIEETMPEPALSHAGQGHVIRLPRADRPRGPHHPFDDAGLSAALGAFTPEDNEHVLCLDIRQPFVTACELEHSLNRYLQTTPAAAIPVMETRDHPCQAMRPIRILEQGRLLVFEPKGSRASGQPKHWPHRPTRPFCLDRATLPDNAGHDLWSLEPETDTLRPLAAGQAHAAALLLRAEDDTAFRLFAHPGRLASLADVPAVLLPASGPVRPVAATADGGLRLPFAPQADPSLLLTAPFADGPAGEAARHVLPALADAALLAGLAPHGHGLVYARLALTPDGVCDMTIPVQTAQAGWDFDHAGRLVDAVTGRRLLGRQDFPPVLARQPGPVFFPRDRDPAALPGLIAAGQAVGHVLAAPALHCERPREAALAACRLVAAGFPEQGKRP